MTNCNLIGKAYGEKCSGTCEHGNKCSVCNEKAVTFGGDGKEYCTNPLCDYMYHARNGHAPDVLRDMKDNYEAYKDAPYLTYVFGKINHSTLKEESSFVDFLKSYVYFLVFKQDGDKFELVGNKSLVRLTEDTDDILNNGQTAYAVQLHVHSSGLSGAKDVYVSNTLFKVGEIYTKEQLGVQVSDSLVLRYNRNPDKPLHEKEDASYYVLVDGKLTPYTRYGVGDKVSEITSTGKIQTLDALYNATYDYYSTLDVEGNTMYLVQGEYQDVPYLTYASEFKQLV